MRKISLVICSFLTIFIACSDDTNADLETTTADLTVQHSEWKTAAISNDIINNQKNISHYEFDVAQLSKLVSQENVTYVWFDLGLNTNKQITFTASGVDDNDIIMDQVPSEIISTGKYSADFSILQQVREAETDYPIEVSHMLPNKDAYKYLNNMNRAYTNFEAGLIYDGERARRFGLESAIVKRILATKDAHSVALFLGENKNQKITTVFIAKDSKGNLLINDNSDINTSGRAFDFTRPCPSDCGTPGCGGCADYCDWPFWICCVAEPACPTIDN